MDIRDPDNYPKQRDWKEYYITEGCGVFAVALARLNGGKICILSKNSGVPYSRKIKFEVTHAYCKAPDGKEYDVYGHRTEKEMMEDMLIYEYSSHGPYDKEDFKKIFMGNSDSKPLYGVEKDIEEAKRLINLTPKEYGLEQNLEYNLGNFR